MVLEPWHVSGQRGYRDDFCEELPEVSPMFNRVSGRQTHHRPMLSLSATLVAPLGWCIQEGGKVAAQLHPERETD